MSNKPKTQKQQKSVFTIVTDRLCQDSSQQFYDQSFVPQNDFNLLGFEFPLNYELQEIHQSPDATQLSIYIQHLESQVKSITNKIEFEYHQARQTVLFVGKTTNMCKHASRKKIDEEFAKMGIMRKYQPQMSKLSVQEIEEQIDDLEQETLAKDVGDFAIDQVKRKIQLQWESQISDEMEKERRRLREAEKKRQKQLQQIDKDFEKLMKKRKAQKQLQAQLRSQQSMKSLQNGQSSSNRTPKKIQKRQKIQRKAGLNNGNNKESRQGSVNEKNSVQGSQIESCSVGNENVGVDEGQQPEF